MLPGMRVAVLGTGAIGSAARAVGGAPTRRFERIATEEAFSTKEVFGGFLELLADRPRCSELGRAGRDALVPWSTLVEDWRAVYADVGRSSSSRRNTSGGPNLS